MKNFKDIYNSISDGVLVSKEGCSSLYQSLIYASKLEGEIAELGVYRGRTAKLLAEVCSNKPIHLFDTFSGTPDTILPIDIHRAGEFKTTLKEVEDYLRDYFNVIFHPGLFPSTTETIKDKKFCFVHCDADLYKSTFDCLDFFYTRIVKGGVMLFHDYEWENCPGVKKAIFDFLVDKPEYPIKLESSYCLLIKI